MMPGLDPNKMQQMLKQLGMKMEELSSTEVVIKRSEGDIVIKNPQVIKTTMKGQIVYQVSGTSEKNLFSKDDIKLVSEQTGVKDNKKIEKALTETKGDVVEAIMKLKS
jgi:nascent polypeptide-associated complex subunit alpha